MVRADGSSVFAYPCIRSFHFAYLIMRENEAYAEVIKAGRRGDTVFLDLGCNSESLVMARSLASDPLT